MSVTSLLDAVEKSPAAKRSKDRIYIDAPSQPVAVTIAQLINSKRTKDAAEKAYKASLATLIGQVDEQHATTCRSGNYCTTVEIPAGEFTYGEGETTEKVKILDTVQVMYKNTYSAFDDTAKKDLLAVVGSDNYGDMFENVCELKMKTDKPREVQTFVEKITTSPVEAVKSPLEALFAHLGRYDMDPALQGLISAVKTEMVKAETPVISPADFVNIFEYKKAVKTTEAFDKLRYSKLTPEQDKKLVALGLKQTISPGFHAPK
jgi:hypothetical protein